MSGARRWIETEIASLDPREDSERIVLLSTNRMLPRFGRRAVMNLLYTLGFLRISAQLEGAAVVDAIGKVHRAGEARAEATMGAFALWISKGPGSAESRASLAEVRRVHDGVAKRHPFSEGEMVHSICLFTVQIEALLARIGVPGYSETEKQAQVAHWLAIGRQLGVEEMPETWGAMVEYMEDYEADPRRFGPSPAGERCARSLIEQFEKQRIPPGLRWSAEPVIGALLEEPVARAVGVRIPRPATRRAIHASLRAVLRAERWVLGDPPELVEPSSLLEGTSA